MDEDNYAENLILEMDRLGIQKSCVSGLGIGKGRPDETDYGKFNLGKLSPDNNDVLAAMKKFPDRLIGFANFRPGTDDPSLVEDFKSGGFSGLKITRTGIDYNDDRCMPIYAEACRLQMPILFHTGIVLVTPFDGEDGVDSDRMRPIKLDRAARRFPDLKIVIAHMGYPWFDEAVVMIRYHKNVYADFTGASMGWRSRRSPEEYLRGMFWPNAFDKIVFGTDTHYRDMKDSMYDQEKLFRLLNFGEETLEKFYYGNAEYLLK